MVEHEQWEDCRCWSNAGAPEFRTAAPWEGAEFSLAGLYCPHCARRIQLAVRRGLPIDRLIALEVMLREHWQRQSDWLAAEGGRIAVISADESG